MEAKEAAAALAQAADALTQAIKTQAIKDTKDLGPLYQLAVGLSAVAGRMEAKEAAAAFTQAIKDTKDPDALQVLAVGLSAVAGRMEAKEAADALTQAIGETKDPADSQTLMEGLSMLAGRLRPTEVAQVAASVIQAMAGMPEQPTGRISELGLAALLSTAFPLEVSTRAVSLTSAGLGDPLTALPFLVAAAEPLPCRLSTTQLVELLKMPGCVGNARRVVLGHLGHRYRRHFADVWEFVRFAQEQRLGLDFTTPPQRPEDAAAARAR
jgi:hypothetical protein